MTGHREEWDVYMTRVSNALTSIGLDLGLRAVSPDRERPTLIRIMIGCRDNRENGMPSSAEFDVLYALEDQVLEFVKRETNWVHVGVATDHRGRELAFYAAEEPGVGPGSFAFIPAERRSESFFSVDEDPDWSYYNDFLFPKPPVLRRMIDNRVLRAIAEDGDDPTISRRVDHWVHFEGFAARDAFAEWVRTQGYTIEQIINPSEDRESIAVQFWSDSETAEETIHTMISRLVDAAEKHGGTYDGWETHVVRAKPSE